MFLEIPKKHWGKGLIEYNKEDLMNPIYLYDFGLDVVHDYASKEGFEPIEANRNMDSYPSLVYKKEGQLYFIYVEADIAKKQPKISIPIKYTMIKHAKKFNAIPLYASCSFGSVDYLRFEQGLALIGDEYYCNFTGFEELKVNENDKTSEEYQTYLLTLLSETIDNKDFEAFKEKYMSNNCQIMLRMSPSKKVLLNYVIKDYLNQYKDKYVFSTLSIINKTNKTSLFIGYEDENGKNCVNLIIHLNEEGKIDYIELFKLTKEEYTIV